MSTRPPTLAVRELRDDELQTAAAVLARGMRDNPGHVAAFGDDPQRRRRCLQRMFTAVFEVMVSQQRICAVDGGAIVGIAAMAVGYLETDKPENVSFYERHGFAVIAQAPVLGNPNWFMRRQPRQDLVAGT